MGTGSRGWVAALGMSVGALVFAPEAGAAFGELTFEGCETGKTTVTVCTGIPSATLTGLDSGLSNTNEVVASPDGEDVYAMSASDEAIAHFSRSTTTGALTYVSCISADAGAASCTQIASATTDGVDSGLENLNQLELSPNGASLYAVAEGDQSVVHFSRNPMTGGLTYEECLTGNSGLSAVCTATGGATAAGTGSGMNQVQDVAVTPNAVYTMSRGDDAVAGFARDTGTGDLTYVACRSGDTAATSCTLIAKATAGGNDSGLNSLSGIATSPDGLSLYTTSDSDHAIARWTRNPVNGIFAYADCITGELATGSTGTDACDDYTTTTTNGINSGLHSLVSVVVSPDNRSVYPVSSGDIGVARFDRDTGGGASHGALTPQGCLTAEDGNTACTEIPTAANLGNDSGLDSPRSAILPPDGRSLYVTASDDTAVAHFARDTSTGALTWVGCLTGETESGPASPAPGSGACAETGGATSTGVNSGLEMVDGIEATGDGKSLYVAAFPDAAVSHLLRENPPDTQIDDGPPASTNDNTPTFEFSAPGDHTTETFECSVDGALFADCTTPTPPSGSHTTTSLADGSHAFEVRGVDSFGFADATPARSSFTVDTQAPNTAILSGPPPGAAIDDATPTFSFSSTESGSTWRCRIDGAVFQPCNSGSFSPASALTDGQHTFEVKASDAATNEDASPATRSFAVDTADPDTTIDAGPAEGATIGDQAPSFAFSASEPGATLQCRFDAGVFQPCSGSFTPSPGLTDGRHAFEVKAVDAAGNEDATPANRSFTVDTDPAETSIVSGPKKKSKKRKAKFEFASDEAGSSFQCNLDDTGFEPCAASASFKVKRGKHTLQVRATDSAGNVDGSPAEQKWKVKKKK